MKRIPLWLKAVTAGPAYIVLLTCLFRWVFVQFGADPGGDGAWMGGIFCGLFGGGATIGAWVAYLFEEEKSHG